MELYGQVRTGFKSASTLHTDHHHHAVAAAAMLAHTNGKFYFKISSSSAAALATAVKVSFSRDHRSIRCKIYIIINVPNERETEFVGKFSQTSSLLLLLLLPFLQHFFACLSHNQFLFHKLLLRLTSSTLQSGHCCPYLFSTSKLSLHGVDHKILVLCPQY